jgi:hypothetical protein
MLKQVPRCVLMEATRLSRTQLTAIRNGHAMPRKKTRESLLRAAENHVANKDNTRSHT